MVLLATVWVSTFGIVRVRYADAERAAAVSSRELLNTYEAQVVRALQEIDRTLNLVRFWREHGNGQLAKLKDGGLLPADLLFVVSVADRNGNIVDTTAAAAAKRPTVSAADLARDRLDRDSIFVGQLPAGLAGDEQLTFSRGLSKADGEFDGVALVAVEAAYFVSGYESSKLGAHGVLGLLGTDGVFRVRRTGDTVYAGGSIDYDSVVPPESDEAAAILSTNKWDGVPRWTSAREISSFPLAIITGLSTSEQLAAANQDRIIDCEWAALASVVIILTTFLVGRMSWQLAQGRRREREQRMEQALRIEYLAFHDALTGLPNRSMFSKLLTQSIKEAHRYSKKLAVAFIDLDRFKQINDSLGHEAGDQLLKEVAARIRQCLRESDIVARLGGDEFVLLLPELSEEHFVAAIAEKILAILARPFNLRGHEYRITASIGVSSFPTDGLDEQTLTKNADIAMYQAKAQGKNNFQLYSERLNTDSLERLTLEAGLRHALANNEFRLLYQAKLDMVSGCVIGVEVLLRWEHPDLGTIPPQRFLPAAEASGLVVAIGKWVLRTACAQNMAWQKQGLPPLIVAINLTERQFFDEHLLADVAAILRDTGMSPLLLEFEIGESLMMRDIDKTGRILKDLKTAGIRLAIDDFGRGYLSLATLQRFPLDTIKIDRCLMQEIAGAASGAGLAESIIELGKNLSLSVVAQGVETKAQADFLRAHAADQLQGFYCNTPLTVEAFTRLLRAGATDVPGFNETAGTL